MCNWQISVVIQCYDKCSWSWIQWLLSLYTCTCISVAWQWQHCWFFYLLTVPSKIAIILEVAIVWKCYLLATWPHIQMIALHAVTHVHKYFSLFITNMLCALVWVSLLCNFRNFCFSRLSFWVCTDTHVWVQSIVLCYIRPDKSEHGGIKVCVCVVWVSCSVTCQVTKQTVVSTIS